MYHLAQQLMPKRIFLVGLVAAVWADFPARSIKVDKVTPASLASITGKLGGSQSRDLTGCMRSKVEEMLRLVKQIPTLSVLIYSGEEPRNVENALCGKLLGRLIASD